MATPNTRRAGNASTGNEPARVRARRAGGRSHASAPIVAIGSSAGGLEALGELLEALPEQPGFAMVLIQHSAPDHESALGEVLRGITDMPIVEVRRAARVKANTVYLMPPASDLTIANGVLRLIERPARAHQPINRFFSDLAHDQAHNAIGVILSGSGTDGTEGMKQIKGAGGLTIVQDPATARHDTMPGSAIAAECADLVLAPAEIAAELQRVCGHGFLRAVEHETSAAPADGEHLHEILGLLEKKSGVDFRDYKQSGVSRRIAKRMALKHVDTLAAYLAELERDPGEIEQLYAEMLVHVTSFFRDEEAFAALADQVIPAIVARAGERGPIRVWAAGCVTGEEAYSIAMLLLERLGNDAQRHKIQIFGTDLSASAIDKARAGSYPAASVEALSPERVHRFFVKLNGRYQVTGRLRELCVFTRHDLGIDPPFSNLDLICCRNVLIYMGSPLQKHVVRKLHYALKPGGYLFLGRTEPLNGYTHLFDVKDRKHRIYMRKSVTPRMRVQSGHLHRQRGLDVSRPLNHPAGPVFDLRRQAERLMINRYGPPGFVLDADLNILHFIGDTSRFLRPMPGEASFNLMTMIVPGLVVELREAVGVARATKQGVARSAVEIEPDGASRDVDFELVPILKGNDPAGFLLLFKSPAASAAPAATAAADDARAEAEESARLREALVATQEHVREMAAEQQARTEELRAANEEILSSNEELQSTNEELETAKEELQATNEELTTVNEELAARNSELDRLTNDLSTILSAIDIPIVLVDRKRRIRRFTPSAEHVFNLVAADLGRPIESINTRITISDLAALIDATLSEGTPAYREVRDHAGRWYALRIHPYLQAVERIEGALVALLDIDSAKRSTTAVVETISTPLVVLDETFCVLSANPAFCAHFALDEGEIENRVLFEAGAGAWDIAPLRHLLEEVLPDQRRFSGFRIEHDFPGVGRKVLLLSAQHLTATGVGASNILLLIEDVTALEATVAALREEHALNERLIETAPVFIVVLDRGGRIMQINPHLEQLSGFASTAVKGRSWFEVFVPAARRKQARADFAAKFGGACAQGAQDRVLTKRGEEIDVEWHSTMLRDGAGEVTAVLCIGFDIRARLQSERELVGREQTLRALSTRLLTAQEDQSRQTARELHDVFGQRLAAMAMELSRIANHAADAEVQSGLRTLAEEVGSLASDLHDTARQIHPRILDDLGLVAALRAACRTTQQQSGVRIGMRAQHVPDSVPREVALCLYRIAQEALRNVAAHARASHVSVSLAGMPDGLGLRVRDNGAGFDPKRVTGTAGVGLTSMEERARLLGGWLRIESRPGRGTTVEARIPVAATPG